MWTCWIRDWYVVAWYYILTVRSCPQETQIDGIRKMQLKDVSSVHKLLMDYLSKFHLHANFTEEEIKHWFIPRKNVVSTFVIEVSMFPFWDFLQMYQVLPTGQCKFMRIFWMYD